MVVILEQLTEVLFRSSDLLSWIVRALIIMNVLMIGVYIKKPEYFNHKLRKRRLKSGLKREEKVLLEQIRAVKRQERELAKQHKVLEQQKKELQTKVEEFTQKSLLLKSMVPRAQAQQAQKVVQSEKGEPKKDNQDLKQFLKMVDNMLANLPEKQITEFSRSKEFELYKEVMNKFGDK